MGFLLKANSALLKATESPVSKGELEAMRSLRRIEREVGVNILGCITAESGTGEATRANIKAIEAMGLPFALNNLVVTPSRHNDGTYTNFSDDNPYFFNLIQINAEAVHAVLGERGADYIRNHYNIACWYWELSRFPGEWIDCFRYFNEIWVASSFTQEAVAEAADIPVVKIPPSVSVERLKKLDRAAFGLGRGDFVFLYIFDFYSILERKNPFAVIRAFDRAFKGKSDAILVIKSINADKNPEARERFHPELGNSKIKIIDRYLDKDELHGLMALSDCYVSLHRSEGFGLTLAESMYLGKPVIATAYSGNMDFMNVNNSFPVRYKLVELTEDFGPYRKGNVWAEPDIEHAASLMRLVYENRKIAIEIGKRASMDIKALYSPSAVGKRISRRFECIRSRLS